MAKYSGKIGIGTTEETYPGVWENVVTERTIYYDVIKCSRFDEKSSNLIDNINISNKISFIADPYTRDNIYNIKYVTFMGAKWDIKSVDVEFPRLILTLGGVYNGQ